MNMSGPNKDLLTNVDIKSENTIAIKHEPIESAYSEDDLNCSTEENQYQASTSCTENLISLGLKNIAPVKTEKNDHKNLIETDDQMMKIGLNVLKVKIEDVDLHLNLKTDVEDYDVNLDKKLHRSMKELNYPKVLITELDINAIKNFEMYESIFFLDGIWHPKNKNQEDNEREEAEGISDESLQSDVKIKKKFKCSLCNYGADHKGTFKRHLLIHSNLKLFKCSECNFSCNLRGNLKKHLLTHNDVKLYNCSECNYSSNRNSDLKSHLLAHSDIKLFKCSECKFSCNARGNLKKHLLKHANTKLLKCSECNFSCNQKSNLKRHLITHTDIKLFKCLECDYSCNRKGNLKIHSLKHADIKFKCSECNYECELEINFKIHLLAHTTPTQ